MSEFSSPGTDPDVLWTKDDEERVQMICSELEQTSLNCIIHEQAVKGTSHTPPSVTRDFNHQQNTLNIG